MRLGVKVGRNAVRGAQEFRHKCSRAHTSDYLGRNARSTAHEHVISAFQHAFFHKSCVYIHFLCAIMRRFLVLNIVDYNNKRSHI